MHLIREFGERKIRGGGGGEGHSAGRRRANAILNGMVREGRLP